MSWTAGRRSRARVGGARDQTGAGAFFCYGGFHRALQASALECREAVIEWAAFAYQAVSEAARVRSTALYGAPRPLWMLVLGPKKRRKRRLPRSPVSRRPRRTRSSGFCCSLPFTKRVSLSFAAEAQSRPAAWVVHSSAVQKLRTDPEIDVLSKPGVRTPRSRKKST